MFTLLKKVRNGLIYSLAGLVILLAVVVGLFRLLLPQLTDYQEDIKSWATAAIGLDVEFSGMNARWRLTGPELNFLDAVLSVPGASGPLIEAEDVTIGVGLVRLLVDRTLVVDRVMVSGTRLSIEQAADGSLQVQGMTPDELENLIPVSGDAGDVVFEGRDIAVEYRKPGYFQPLLYRFELLQAVRRDDSLSVEASLDIEEGFGSRLEFTADRDVSGDSPVWQLYLDGRSLSLGIWAALVPDERFRGLDGFGDFSVWMEYSSGALDRATVNVTLTDVTPSAAAAPIDIDGRFEYSRIDRGFLVAAENMSLVTAAGRWPDSRLQLQVLNAGGNGIDELRLNASYANLSDIALFSRFLPDGVNQRLISLEPEGEVRNLRLVLQSLQTESPAFEVSLDASNAGVAANDSWPGVRGFSGTVRADSSGGRLESRSGMLSVSVPDLLPEAVQLDELTGTIIWRRSGEQLTVLTDRMRVRGPEFDSRTSVQVTLPGEDGAPIVDLDSRWSISDVSVAKRLIPPSIMLPQLYDWFQQALVSGRLTNGTTRLVGPLDRFPFDNGEGRFELYARYEDGVFDYAPGWPAANVSHMDVSLIGTRLATRQNNATAAGNRTVDAEVFIDDLRDPVLVIDAMATGSLETIRQFGLQSPIAQVFNGRLADVAVSGAASFSLELELPIRARQDYRFESRIQPNDGVVTLAGFPAPVTALHGVVTITRDSLSTDALFGNFLGDPVNLDLRRIDDDSSSYSVELNADGRVSAEGLMTGLSAPIEGLLAGATDYSATVRFPRAGLEEPAAIKISIASPLRGMEILLPEPLAKSPGEQRDLSLDIDILPAGQIATVGRMANGLRYDSRFLRSDAGWDFDRGTLIIGEGEPFEPASRGLHIKGSTDEVRLDRWLAAARDGRADGPRFADRIRSIDLQVGQLRMFGQLFTDHRIVVDRSGSEWFARAEGNLLDGTATIPYDLSGDRPISLDMNRLILPGDDGAPDVAVEDLDPRRVPAVSINAREFAIGDRHVGALSAEFVRTEAGLAAESVRATDESFSIEGSAGWTVGPAANATPVTAVRARLVSNDAQRTLTRLGYEPAIDSDDMEISADLYWPGGPRADFLDQLSGEFSIRFGEGSLNEIEPGAGRIFGLMSIVALPRRLSLDFRDVFERGFGFDEITGSFELDEGNAYTCDLSLKGPAADIGIVGRVDLGEGSYQQTALVSANVGNTLPVVGAVVAGPQVAAALLIFSQIFKKPLQEMGQIYYAIDGALDEPSVETADAERFAASSEIANCLAEAQ